MKFINFANFSRLAFLLTLTIACPKLVFGQKSVSGLPEGWTVNGITPYEGEVTGVPDSTVITLTPSPQDMKRVKRIRIIAENNAEASVVVVEKAADTLAEPLDTADTAAVPSKDAVKTGQTSIPKIGWILASDGMIYPDAKTALNYGVTPRAVIAYVGNEAKCTRGLAISLEDVSLDQMTWKETAEVVRVKAKDCPTVGAEWRLPSVSDLKVLFKACGGSADTLLQHEGLKCDDLYLRQTILKAGGTDFRMHFYWTSDESSPYTAWQYRFNSSKFYTANKTLQFYARLVLAF